MSQIRGYFVSIVVHFDALKANPSKIEKPIKEEPPKLKNGNVIPVGGNIATFTLLWRKLWTRIKQAEPIKNNLADIFVIVDCFLISK